MGNGPKQKSIGVTSKEKEKLDKAKHLYERHTGDRADWGRFLGVLAILGLGALGIYKLAQGSRKDPKIICPVCGEQFLMVYPDDCPTAIYIRCPNPDCGAELVVNFGEP